jgi:hypothetical protein
VDFVAPEQEQDSRKFLTAAIQYGHQCFDRDWMAAGPLIDDEDRRGVLFRISVEELQYGLVECMEAQPDEEDELVLGDAATPDPDRA